MRNRFGNLILAVIAAALGTAIALQAMANASLRRSNRRLADEAAQQKVTAAARETFAKESSDRAASQEMAERARLQESIQQLRTQLAAGLMRSTMRSHASTPQVAERWKDRGRATPSDTVQSVLWAAMSGEVDKLSSMLAFDPEVQSAARARFEMLPQSARSEYGSAELLATTILAAQIPTQLSAAELIDTSEEGPDRMSARFLLLHGSARPENAREVTLKFIRSPEGWSLIVPAEAFR